MKTKLLLPSFLLITLIGYSQAAIEQFQSATGAQYLVVTGTIDQTPSGASASWDFTSLTNTSTILTDTYIDTSPTSVIQTFNGGTLVSNIALNNTAGTLSITAILSQGVQLNYTNSAVIGTFPLNFGYTNIDAVEGTFTSTLANGDVLNTSTINVSVDAWGTLKVGSFDGPVTRLKIVQNLNLSAFGGFVTGTGTQTSYFYYDATNDDLVFRTNRLEIPIASIDETTMESLLIYTLDTNSYQVTGSDIELITNPVQDVLRFHVSDFTEIKAITISDISGRIVLKVDSNESSLDVKSLKSGLFLVSITTNKGVVTKKFIKK